jgi:hypothetical protein
VPPAGGAPIWPPGAWNGGSAVAGNGGWIFTPGGGGRLASPALAAGAGTGRGGGLPRSTTGSVTRSQSARAGILRSPRPAAAGMYTDNAAAAEAASGRGSGAGVEGMRSPPRIRFASEEREV